MGEFLLILAAFAADMLGRFRRWLTWRRVLGILALLAILMFARLLIEAGADLTFLFGLDLGLVVEVSALMIILSVRARVKTAAYLVRRGPQQLRIIGRFAWRGVRRAIRTARPLLPPPPDDAPVWAFA